MAVYLTLSFSLILGLQLGPSGGHIGLAGLALPTAARVYLEFVTKR